MSDAKGYGLGFRVQGSGFRVMGVVSMSGDARGSIQAAAWGLGVKGQGLGVKGLGLRA